MAAALSLWILVAGAFGAPGVAADPGLALRARTRIVAALVQAGAAGLRVTERRFARMRPGQLRVFLAGLPARHPRPTDRLLAVSAGFLGTPYMASPLGEGAGREPDPDPIFRLDGVDCTTFVEQTLAMASANSLPQALSALRRVRYLDGRMEYGARKHFMEAQWIPANQRAGWLADITVEVAGERVVWIEKRLDRQVWQRRSKPEKWPLLATERIPEGLFRLPVVPLDQVLDLAGRIPSGTLVNVVRRDIPSYPTRVTHQGILVHRAGRTLLRHAGRAGYGRVVDEALAHFVGRNLAYRKWVVTGFNLQRLLPGPAGIRERPPDVGNRGKQQ